MYRQNHTKQQEKIASLIRLNNEKDTEIQKLKTNHDSSKSALEVPRVIEPKKKKRNRNRNRKQNKSIPEKNHYSEQDTKQAADFSAGDVSRRPKSSNN